jgi:hypothetical protein
MDLKRLADKAKDLVDKRGGTDSLKEDAGELKDIATGKGSLTDKAKAAAEAIKQPGGGADEVGRRVEDAAPDEPPADVAGDAARGGRAGRKGRGQRHRRRRARGV